MVGDGVAGSEALTGVRIDLILVPWDSGRRGERMGRGPEVLAAELAQRLRALRHRVETITVESRLEFATEAATAFDLAHGVAECVRSAQGAGRFPVVLAGNCASAVGTVAGLGGGPATGVLWFDAHADFNTPDTSTSAFLDGMAVAILTGECWTAAATQTAGLLPVREQNVLLVGARDMDEEEARRVDASVMTVLPPGRAREAAAVQDAIVASIGGADRLYVHVDLDVLDPDRVGRANGFAAADGLSVEEVLDVLGAAAKSHGIAALNVCAFDPTLDPDGAVAEAAFSVIAACVHRAAF